MERIKKFVVRYLGPKPVNLVEPFPWTTELTGNKIVHSGDFVIFGRFGRIRFRVQGRIVQWVRMPTEVYVYNPPEFIKKHPHGSCFQLLRPKDKWFKLHFDNPPTDFTCAYNYVEEILNEAYQLRKK